MTPEEKPAFVKLLSTLFGAHGKPLSEGMIAGYWKGLQKMHLQTFERCCDKAIEKLEFAERGMAKTPTVSELWDIKRGFSGRPPVTVENNEPIWQGDEWDVAANQCLMAHIANNSRKPVPIDYAPDAPYDPNARCVMPGYHTQNIAKILRRYARQWADSRRADAADGITKGGREDWLSYMSQADNEIVSYLRQMQVAA